MRPKLIVAMFLMSLASLAASNTCAGPLQVDWLIQYCNEDIQTTVLADDPRMLRNISNSLMTSGPSYLDGSIYLQRRQSFTDLCPELEGIGEPSREWLRPDRVTLSDSAVIVAAVREDLYPGSGALLSGLGWTPLGDTITLGYVDGVANIPLYAGLVPAGDLQISGADVDQLRNSSNITITSHYFFFQEASAFSPEVLSQLNVVAVPEPQSVLLAGCGLLGLVPFGLRRARRRV